MATNPLFIYHPPTDEQKVLYERLAEAYAGVYRVMTKALRALGKRPAQPEDYDAITDACEGYYNVIMEVCPASADRTAAIRCLRLARNAMNDCLRLPEDRSVFWTLAEQELIKCRYQAHASIALDGKV